MIRLDWVPLPAPGGPSNTTGPNSCEVSCPIGLAKASRPQPPRRSRNPAELQQPQSLPSSAAADTSTARRKPVVMPHDQLRFNLLHSIHCHAHDDQQRCAAKIEIHTQTVGHPGWHSFEKPSQHSWKVIQV